MALYLLAFIAQEPKAPSRILSHKETVPMGNISFSGLPEDTHHCTSHREGDWVIWRCPLCAGYERRMNWYTGEMRVKRGNSVAQHTGTNTGTQNMEALTHIIRHN